MGMSNPYGSIYRLTERVPDSAAEKENRLMNLVRAKVRTVRLPQLAGRRRTQELLETLVISGASGEGGGLLCIGVTGDVRLLCKVSRLEVSQVSGLVKDIRECCSAYCH